MPHSRLQVELGFILQAGTCQILNFAQSPRQSQSVQGTELNLGGGDTAQKKCIPGIYFLNRRTIGGTPHIKYDHMFILGWGHRTQFQTLAVGRVGGLVAGWVGGRDMLRIMPFRGSILQVKICKILSYAENPRWGRVWQN